MSQTVLLHGSSDANIPRLPPQMVVNVADFSPQQMQQLLAQAELGSGNVIATHPTPEDVMLAPLLAPLASQHHNSEYSMQKNPNRVNGQYCPLSITMPQHIQLLRQKQAAFLETNGAELLYRSSGPASKFLSQKDYISFPQDIRGVCSLEDDTLPFAPLSPCSAPDSTTSGSIGSNLSIIEAVDTSVSSLPLTVRVIPELTPPLSSSLSRELSGALVSPLDRFGIKPVRPPLENRHHSSPITVVDTRPQPKTSQSHPINVATIIPPNVLSILSSSLKNDFPSEFTAAQGRMSTVFSISSNLALPYLVSLSPVAVMGSETAQSLCEHLVECRDRATETTTHPFPSHLHNHWSPVTVLGNENAINSPRRLDYNDAVANKPPRPWSVPIVALDRVIDLVSSFSAITAFANRPGRVVDSTAPQSGPYSVGEYGTTKRNRTPIVGNMILSSCPGKKVRLSAPAIKTATSRSAFNRDLTADLERIASLRVKLIINCLSDEELAFLGSPWPKYLTVARQLGIDVLRMPMPEGLAPLKVEDVDREMELVISQYTAEGRDVLAHCRGGLGRAGLIACCWMIKLGVCGSLPAAPQPQAGFVRPDTLALVESAIKVVRHRRSLKAIETYEQVKFLVDFVDYLRQKPLITPCPKACKQTPPPQNSQ